MSSADVALLITAIGGAFAAIVTSLAALRNSNYNADKLKTLEKENERLRAENDKKTQHNDYQDAVILEQQSKIQKWSAWGDRIGRQMNEMQLQIGYQQQARPMQKSNDDTQPLRRPVDKDWITGPLGPLDATTLRDD